METTNQEREKHIKKEMEDTKKRYKTVNDKLWIVETRMDTMSRKQAEISWAIQSKLNALLRNSFVEDKSAADKQLGTRVDFVEPQRKKQESTPLPQINKSLGSVMTKAATKGKASTQRGYPRIQVHTRV